MLVALVLECLSLLLPGDLLLLLLGECGLFFLLALFLLLGPPLGGLFLGLLAGLLLLLLRFCLLSLHVHQVNACQFLEDVHETRVHLNHLHEHLGVLFAKLKGVPEFRVLEVPRDAWIRH